MKQSVIEEFKLGQGQWKELLKQRPARVEQIEQIITRNQQPHSIELTDPPSLQERHQPHPVLASSSKTDVGMDALRLATSSPAQHITSEGDVIIKSIETNNFPITEFEENVRFRLLVGVMLQFFQQLTGINAVMYYAPVIFSNVALDTLLSNLVVGLVNFFATFIAVWLVCIIPHSIESTILK
jgi:hypothetical protein